MSVPFSISRKIMSMKGMDIKFHTKLIIDDKKNSQYKLYHNSFEFNNKNYIVIESSSYITLSYLTNEREKEFEDSVMITYRNIYYLINGLKDMRKIMYNKDTYYIKNKKLHVSDLENNKVVLSGLGKENSIMMFPAIAEIDNIEYEIIALCIKTPDRLVEIDLELFDAIIYNLSKVDFFMYSQSLINYFISSVGKYHILMQNMPKYDLLARNSFINMKQKDAIKDIDIPDKIIKKESDIFNSIGLN